jgi:hypothetical protein
MEVQCPRCGQRIAPDDVNVARDIAFCRRCNEVHALSDTLAVTDIEDADLSAPPDGVTVEDYGGRFALEASLRSGAAVFFVIFALFWNSIVWSFVFAAVAAAITGEEMFDDGPFPGFVFVFMIPFVLVGLGTGYAALLGLFGKVRIALEGGILTVRTGVAGLNRTKMVAWDDVTEVRMKEVARTSTNHGPSKPVYAIEIDGVRPFTFGVFLKEPRREYIAGVLRKKLRERR